MDRRQLLRTAGGFGAAAFLSHCGRSSGPPQPNVLVVMTDDQTADQMSCAGHELLRTPSMDRLAHEGVRFANGFCTNSLCAPGRAAVLTGTYSHVNGIRGNSQNADAIERIGPEVPTYPQLLQEAGYRTGLFGKWHLPEEPKGFDEWRILPGQGVYFDPDFIVNGERQRQRGYTTDVTTEFALDFLGRSQGGPFCMVYQQKAPHRPFTPAPRHAKLFDDIEWPYPETYDDDYATRSVAERALDMRFEISLKTDYHGEIPGQLSPREERDWIFQRFVKDHHRAVVGVDEGLGHVLEYLDDSGLAEDTLVVYTSDNGFYLGDHGWYDKRFMYEPSLRIPILLRYPRMVSPGQVESRIVLHQDIAPTILDFAGVPIPDIMQGRSLRQVVTGSPEEDWRESMLYAYYEDSWARNGPNFVPRPGNYGTPHRVTPHRGIRTDRYKLIEYYREGDYWELFDLEEDPNELRNLYSEAGHAGLIRDLTAELRALQQHYREDG
ncbi:MAG: sulfatase [Bryobacterales bacterium]|nr:sulfatase [Bryobacterales bacterium]MDE0622350.1 sulfatase [Bryobacterales bacterium]